MQAAFEGEFSDLSVVLSSGCPERSVQKNQPSDIGRPETLQKKNTRKSGYKCVHRWSRVKEKQAENKMILTSSTW